MRVRAARGEHPCRGVSLAKEIRMGRLVIVLTVGSSVLLGVSTGVSTAEVRRIGDASSSVSRSPSSAYNQVLGVSAISATDAWAVGSHAPGVDIARVTLTLHWDGSNWSRIP